MSTNIEAAERRMDAFSRRIDYLEERLGEAEEKIEALERQKSEVGGSAKPLAPGGDD